MIFNLLGLGMLVAAVFLGAIPTALLFHTNGAPLLYGIGTAPILMDLAHRADKGNQQDFVPCSGGYIMFIPLCILGIAAPFVPTLP